MINSSISDKIILVTGASSGIGKATALDLARKGAKAISLFARSADKLQAVADEIAALKNSDTKTLVIVGDASKVADNEQAVQETVKAFGGIASAFINAAPYAGGANIDVTADDDVDMLLNVNIKGVICALRYLIPAIKVAIGDTKTDPTGSVVIASSCMGEAVIGPKSAGSGVCSASKAFVNSLVKMAAIENAPRIRVNGVMPGVIQTNIMPVDNDTHQMMGAALQPLWGRPGQPKEIASLASFLLGDDASFVSGSNIKADGLWGLSGGGM